MKRLTLGDVENKRQEKRTEGQGIKAYTGGLTNPIPTQTQKSEKKLHTFRMSEDIGQMLDQIISMSALAGTKLKKGEYAESILRPAFEAKIDELKKNFHVS